MKPTDREQAQIRLEIFRTTQTPGWKQIENIIKDRIEENRSLLERDNFRDMDQKLRGENASLRFLLHKIENIQKEFKPV